MIPTKLKPLALTDDHLSEIVDVAKALSVDRRGTFLHVFAERLRRHPHYSTGDVKWAAIIVAREGPDPGVYAFGQGTMHTVPEWRASSP